MMSMGENKSSGCPVEEGSHQTPNAPELEPRQEPAPTSVENDGGSANTVDNPPALESKTTDQDGSLEACKSDQENAFEGSSVENEGERKEGGDIEPQRNQWYKRNPALAKMEVAVMKRFFTHAKYKILNSGDMVWIVKMKISRTGFCKPWTFLLRYEPDHPNLNKFGGSVQVLLFDPDHDELIDRAKAAGRPGVPCLRKSFAEVGSAGLSFATLRFLIPESFYNTSNNRVISAAAWAAMAAKWALHFEIGLRDVDFWNHWCDYEYCNKLAIETDNAGEVRDPEGILSEDQKEEIQQLMTALKNNGKLWVNHDGIILAVLVQ